MASAKRKEWWQTFFRGAWLDFQVSMDEPQRVKAVVDFLEGALDLPGGARVLDAPCGEGRVARELARRGYRVTGLDITPALLREARRRARRDGLTVDWVQGDMRRPPGRGRYDLALCWWGSFGYFSDADNVRHVRAMASRLKSGGVFALDTHSPETIFPSFLQRWWIERGGVLVLNKSAYDHDTGRIETDWTFIRDGRRSRSHSSIRLYTLRELRELFGQAGFTEFHAHGNLDGEAFELDSRRLLFLARKGR